MGRIGRGWVLAKKSLVVVREDGSLAALTILGGVSAAAIGLALLIPAAIVTTRETGRRCPAQRARRLPRDGDRRLLRRCARELRGRSARRQGRDGRRRNPGRGFPAARDPRLGGIVLGHAASAVFGVVLYRYASGEGTTGPFGPDELQASVISK